MKALHVAVAVISDAQGRILLAKRADDAHQGGLWEFPGGKVEASESLASALVRECREELGIEVRAHRPLIRITHSYPDRTVLLDVHRVEAFEGTPRGLEGQPLAWVAPAELDSYPMPAADVPIVHAIRLPARYLITPPLATSRDSFLQALAQGLGRGVELVQFRVRESATDLASLAAAALALCQSRGARMLINGDIDLARAIGADGVHLQSRQLYELSERPAGLTWVGASCHTGQDVTRLAALAVDFAVLSPVKPTLSHPDARPIGWEGFTALARQAQRPVYALGGLSSDDLADAWAAGAQGVAAIRGFQE